MLNMSTRKNHSHSVSSDPLNGKKIVLGITGCIAAYKTPFLVREFVKRGAGVKVVMTPSAAEFVTPLTLSTLSLNGVTLDIFPPNQKGNVDLSVWHIDLGLWADCMLIAPLSVNTLAKLAVGICDNAVTTLAAAMRAPLIVSPAADVDMYEHPAAQQNMETLRQRGVYLLDAEEGELASGLIGTGRLPDLNKIVDSTELILTGFKRDLLGRTILITGGPTYEDIDPVRYIGNRSSGKMGAELAKAARLRGAHVTYISGPSDVSLYRDIRRIDVRSAEDMKKAVMKELPQHDTLVMAAAVADYKPAEYSTGKIKKTSGMDAISLAQTDDILAAINDESKMIIGFALETDNELENAAEKLKRKNLDLIVLNSLRDEGSGFEFDTNSVSIVAESGVIEKTGLQSKFQTANIILNHVTRS